MSEGRGDKMKIALGGLGLVSGTVSNSVTVHNGPHALSTVQIPGPIRGGGGVVVTPLRPQPVIEKVLIKVCSRSNKKDSKMFTLRNIILSNSSSVENLKGIIKTQLGDEICSNFDVGYLQGSSAVYLRSREDLSEVWSNIQKGTNVILWCDGLKKVGNKKTIKELSSDDELEEVQSIKKKRRKSQEREDLVDETIKELKTKYGATYTPMQYRIWAEMCSAGVHTSRDNPPATTMFLRAGGGTASAKKKSISTGETVSCALTELTSVLIPQLSGSGSTMNSPAKLIDSRTKCYKQLSDIKNLLESGVLSTGEYNSEKAVILKMLKKLS